MSIPKKYYDFPTQVMFAVQDDLDEGECRKLGGIAYHDVVICLECGEAIPLYLIDYELGFKELSWISLSEECLGDEVFEENLDKEIQKSDSNSQELSDHFHYIRAVFTNHIQLSEDDTAYWKGQGKYYKFPSYYNDYMIEKAIQENYVEWAKEIYKGVVPDSMLERFQQMLDEYGPSKEDYSWEEIPKEKYRFYSKQ